MHRILLALYTTVFVLSWPWIALRLWWRGKKAPAYRERWKERWAMDLPQAKRPVIWVHAVSVGETMAAIPLVRRLKNDWPEHDILVTSTTPTGSERVQAAFSSEVLHTYLPYDVPCLMRRFLRTVRPQVAVFMETEIWPNSLRLCAARGIPTIIANARMSRRSARGYARLSKLTRPVFESLSLVLASGHKDARRFEALGVPPGRIQVCGNVKFDVGVPDEQIQRGRQLRTDVFKKRPVLCVASTHEGEDEVLANVVATIRRSCPELAVIWVPRHPERFDVVSRLLQKQDWKLLRRSEWTEGKNAPADVVLGDSMGEMFMYYAAADMAFVGGSLQPIGGHNPMEPAALGLPVICGPYTFNFAEVSDALERAGGLVRADTGELADVLVLWLREPQRRAAVGDAAKAWVRRNRGASDCMARAIRSHLLRDVQTKPHC